MSLYYLHALEKCLNIGDQNSSSITNESALCLSMCPPEETQKRISNTHDRDFTVAEQQDRIHVLEGADPSIIDEFTNTPIKQENLLVKVYARSNDQETKQPSTLRPPSVLEKTVLHLVHYCLRVGGTKDPRLPDRIITFSDVYAFMSDRFKMIHRDAIWQGTAAHNQIDVLIRIHEIMCRVLILFTHYCYGETDFLSSRDKTLDKWFAELIELYILAVEKDHYEYCSNCGEFLGYYVIYFYSLRQRAKDDQITFTSNLSKAHLILSTVIPHLPEAIRLRNQSLFSDALDLIANLESFNGAALYNSFNKTNPLFIILLFYGNIGLIRVNSAGRLWLMSKTEVTIPNLERFLFCDSVEIESILKNYNIIYNRDSNTIKRVDKWTNPVVHYDRPVSFIQERINSFSLEDLALGASAEYPLSLPPSSLSLKAIIPQPLAPDAIALFDKKDDSALPTYFSKEVNMVPHMTETVPTETETLSQSNLFSNKTPFLNVMNETPAVPSSLFSFQTPTEVSLNKEGITPSVTSSLFSVLAGNQSNNEPDSSITLPPVVNIASCLLNPSNSVKLSDTPSFSMFAGQTSSRSPFFSYSFTECAEEEDQGEGEEDQDSYLFSSILSENEMERALSLKAEEEERLKREAEERKAEERRKAEEEKRAEEKRKEEEKKEKELREQKEHEARIQKIVEEYKNDVADLNKRVDQWNEQINKRLTSIADRISTMHSRVYDLQKLSKQQYHQKQLALKEYQLDHGESLCHVHGSVSSFHALHPGSLKRPYCIESFSSFKRSKDQSYCDLILPIPVKQCRNISVSFGCQDGINSSSFKSFLSFFQVAGVSLQSDSRGGYGYLQSKAFYTVEVHIEEKEENSDLHFHYHNINSMRLVNQVKGGSHRIECVECPSWLVPHLQKKLKNVEHLVFLNQPSSMNNLRDTYYTVLSGLLNEAEERILQLTVGDLLWKLLSSACYSKWSEVSLDQMKSSFLSVLFDLVKGQMNAGSFNQMKMDFNQSVVNFNSMYHYCYENSIMQCQIVLQSSLLEKGVRRIRESLQVNSVILKENTVTQDVSEERSEELSIEIQKERMKSKLFLTQLQDSVIERDIDSITINECDLLY